METVERLLEVNPAFLRAVGELYRASGHGSVKVEHGAARRTAHLEHGRLVSVSSNLAPDRIGELLVSEGRLEAELVEPVAQLAQRKGRLFGDQLVADGILSPAELAHALERQALLRFKRAALMHGEVASGEAGTARPSLGRPVGPLVVDLLRRRVPYVALQALVAALPEGPVSVTAPQSRLMALALVPLEVGICKQLLRPRGLAGLTAEYSDEAETWEGALRFLCALEVLGFLEQGG